LVDILEREKVFDVCTGDISLFSFGYNKLGAIRSDY